MEGHGHSRRRRGDGCIVVQCYTPRRVVSRLLSGLRSSKGKRQAGEVQDEADKVAHHLARCSTKRINDSRLLDTKPETSRFDESQSREAPLEMGIGSFLLYLVVASKTELDKMANLRTQMEMLLQNAKEELQKNDAYAKEAKGGNQFSPQVISNLASSIFEGSSTSVLQEENSEYEVSKPEDCHRGTDRNAKLQAEDNENHVPEMVPDERYGVCPYELEKKLHELLEARQQEELQKLETALSRVERRLQEKETEVSWWKDAARLLALRVPESSRAGLEWCNPESSSITCLEDFGPVSPR
ncbi:Protein POLAR LOCALIZATION DURING ASYMMETRIC DIVISION AND REDISTRIBUTION [Hirschfeldia incana]|nr:Protein POLAR LOCALIZATION DURING ASYMMETRIC DIVISION AND REDISTRIBUTION [Hirschfeldia incana]